MAETVKIEFSISELAALIDAVLEDARCNRDEPQLLNKLLVGRDEFNNLRKGVK